MLILVLVVRTNCNKIRSTYHHQECKNPGGSPNVMFFSHLICNTNGDEWKKIMQNNFQCHKIIIIWSQYKYDNQGMRVIIEITEEKSQLIRLLTSDKNVCALFCAPTCNKYSYTYNANLQRNKTNYEQGYKLFIFGVGLFCEH